jgi:transposase-like protein
LSNKTGVVGQHYLQGMFVAQHCRNRYNEEFKKQAVVHHLEIKAKLSDSAEKLGITPSMLCKWVEQYSSTKAGQALNCEEEIIKLKDEVSALKRIVGKAFLKKYSIEDMIDNMSNEPGKFLIDDKFPLEK